MPSPTVQQARAKRKAGEPLSLEEQLLLQRCDAKYVKRQVKVTLTEQEIQVYGDRARSEGFEFASWLARLVRLGAQGGFVALEAHQRLEREAKRLQEDNERLRLEGAEQQIRLAGSQRLVAQYQQEFRELALKVPREA